jgi:hypothetical protein
MKRFRIPELIVGFLLGFASLLIIFLLSSDFAAHYEVCETTKEGARECANYSVIHFVVHKIRTALDSYNGLITAIATIFIAWFTLSLRQSTDKLWDAGERQLKLLADTSAIQSRDMQDSIAVAKRSAEVAENSIVQLQRALIVLTNFNIDTLVRGQSIIGYQISAMFENTGNTIAKRYTGNANIVMWDGDLPPAFPFADRQSVGVANGFVGPRVKVPFPISIAIQDVLDILKKKRRGFMYGWVEYEDVFEIGRKRRTEFCVELDIIGDPLVRSEKSSIFGFGGYGKYNGTDEDCLYKPGERPPLGGLPEPTQPPPAPPTTL